MSSSDVDVCIATPSALADMLRSVSSHLLSFRADCIFGCVAGRLLVPLLQESNVLRTQSPRSIFATIAAAFLLTLPVGAEWPTDDEPMGIMGCRWFRFRGIWESEEISFDEEENTNAACLTVAAASIINFHRWPKASYFDALYATCHTRGESVPIAHKWNFALINGPGGPNANCISDDPMARVAPATEPAWTGVSEIRKLMYTIERAYGHDHECFRAHSRECEGLGDFPVHHMMRNRFGYPHASSLSVQNPQARKTAIRNIKDGCPVIAVKCEHVYPLDGYKVHPKTGEGLFHACDYVSAEESTGWFTWKSLMETGLIRIIGDLSPDVAIGPRPGQAKIAYWWGDEYLPQTSYTTRKGFLRIQNPAGTPIGALDVVVSLRHRDSLGEAATHQLALYKGTVAGSVLRVPAKDSFNFSISKACVVTVVLRNNEPEPRRLRIVFHDFAGKHDLEAWQEKKLFGPK
jgi:hypothetical protein